MSTFSEKLKELRKAANLTQQQMAENLNMRQQSYSRYEYGQSEPNLETLVKISKILDVSLECLLGLED